MSATTGRTAVQSNAVRARAQDVFLRARLRLTDRSARQRGREKRNPFQELVAIPERSILAVEWNQLAVVAGARLEQLDIVRPCSSTR
jgi:hypothetical protein